MLEREREFIRDLSFHNGMRKWGREVSVSD